MASGLRLMFSIVSVRFSGGMDKEGGVEVR